MFKNWKCVVFEEADSILDGVEVIVNPLCGLASIQKSSLHVILLTVQHQHEVQATNLKINHVSGPHSKRSESKAQKLRLMLLCCRFKFRTEFKFWPFFIYRFQTLIKIITGLD